jgi:hypothetical protein
MPTETKPNRSTTGPHKAPESVHDVTPGSVVQKYPNKQHFGYEAR